MTEQADLEIEGAARIYARAMKWGHLPAAMTFESFLAALRRGDDPYLAPRDDAPRREQSRAPRQAIPRERYRL